MPNRNERVMQHLRNELRGEHPQEVIDLTVERWLADIRAQGVVQGDDQPILLMRDREFSYAECRSVAWVYVWFGLGLVAALAMWWWVTR